jgi:GntR family transcriptional regulator
VYNKDRISDGYIPKYRQLLQILRNHIFSGEWQAGSRLPTEEELARTYNLSRGTVRKAVAQLDAERLVRVEHGVGTFVRPTPTHAIPFRFEDRGFWLERTGSKLTYEVLANEVVPAPLDAAERLGLAPATDVVRIERLELLDGEVIAHTLRYLPEALYPSIVEADLDNVSLHTVLVTASEVPLLRTEMSIEMHVLTGDEAALLRTEEGAHGVVIDRLTYTAPNRPAVWYRGLVKDQYFFGVRVDHEAYANAV